jgi:hypothetical protein
MNATLTLSTIMFDSADPAALAAFYSRATGWPVTESDDTFVYLGEGPVTLAFQRVPDYQAAGWPDPAKHAHLDFKAADKAQAVQDLLAAGAKLPDFQPGGDDWTVLTDPEGHPFCVSGE